MSKKAFDKIADGLNEALAVVRGEAEPARVTTAAVRGVNDWRSTKTPPEEFTKVWLARQPYRNEWAYGVGACIKREDGKVWWSWTGSGDPTHWAPITPPEDAL